VATIACDPNMQQNIEKLRSEGWDLRENVPPVAVYHLQRPRVRQGVQAGHGGLGIDDSKIHIIKGGSNGRDNNP
jgi:hypothetical protein